MVEEISKSSGEYYGVSRIGIERKNSYHKTTRNQIARISPESKPSYDMT